MIAKPKLSVIVPSYRPKSYIYDCLENLIHQSLEADFFQVIVVLNGTKQPYYDDICAYLEGRSNFDVAYSPEASVSKARNLGLEMASGSHILFVDDDDFLSKNFLKSIFNALRDAPNALILCNFLRYSEQTGASDDYMSKTYRSLVGYEGRLKWSKFRKLLSSACGKAIPVSIVRKVRFNERMKISEDALFMFEICKNVEVVKFCSPDAVYYRRIRDSSASRREVGIKTHLKTYTKTIYEFSRVYFKNLRSYSPLFYINRLLAATKHLIYRVIKR